MDALTLILILIIACTGFVTIALGMWSESETVRKRWVWRERREIINAIINIRPMASNPDVRDTKNEIIDAITKRDSA